MAFFLLDTAKRLFKPRPKDEKRKKRARDAEQRADAADPRAEKRTR